VSNRKSHRRGGQRHKKERGSTGSVWPKNRSEARAGSKRKKVRRGKDRKSTARRLSVSGFCKTKRDPRARVAANRDLKAIKRGHEL